MIGYPVNQDLVTRLLRCPLIPKERTFLESLVGRQTMSGPQFDWLHGMASRHKRRLQALAKEWSTCPSSAIGSSPAACVVAPGRRARPSPLQVQIIGEPTALQLREMIRRVQQVTV